MVRTVKKRTTRAGKRRGPKPAVLRVNVPPQEVLRRMFAAKPEKPTDKRTKA